jgi:hypothetical protein
MIRSVEAAGPVKVAGLVAWQLRWDLLAVLIIAAVMVAIPDGVQSENAVAVLSVLGIAASIFIGFRNSNAYARWWGREPCGAASSSTAAGCTTGCAPSTPGRRQWPRSWIGCAAVRFATPGSWRPKCAEYHWYPEWSS